MEKVAILPHKCKEVVTIQPPSSSCIDILQTGSMKPKPKADLFKRSSDSQLKPALVPKRPSPVSPPRKSLVAIESPPRQLKEPTMKKHKKSVKFHPDDVKVDDTNLDLLINPTKLKTPEHAARDADLEFARKQPKPLNLFAKKKPSKKTRPVPEEEDEDDESEGGEEDEEDLSEDEFDDEDEDDDEEEEDDDPQQLALREQPLSRRELIRRKAQVLAKLERRERFTGQRIDYKTDMSLEELEVIDAKYSYQANSDVSVKIMRQLLMFSVATIESISKSMPFLQLDLESWSETVFLNLNQYDELLFEIYDYYSSDIDVNPLIKLGFAIVSSAMMHSFSRKIMRNAVSMGRPNPVPAPPPPPARVPTAPNPAPPNAHEDLDEIGTMTGPGDVPQEQLLNLLRDEQDSREKTTTTATPATKQGRGGSGTETKEVTVTPAARRRGPTTPKSTAGGSKTIVSL